MTEETELERWWNNGVPPDMFIYPSAIQFDVQTLIGAIIDHIEARR